MTTHFTQWRFLSLVDGTLVLCGLLGACASSRLLKKPLPTKVPDLGWAASAPEGLNVEVHQLILGNGGGSWVRDANWDEYVLTIESDSQAPSSSGGGQRCHARSRRASPQPVASSFR
jgi:hypothetical protein